MYDTTNGETYSPYSGYFTSMGTVITLQVYETSETRANKIYNDIKAIYDTYDKISDDGYDSYFGQSYDSELAKLNQSRSMNVSDELLNLLKFAVKLQEETNGYYNPFMGELNHEWKDYINMVGYMPSDYECMYYASNARNTYLEFGDNNLVTIKNNDINDNFAKIDLGGIAKGYATNLAYNYFKENNIKYYYLNAGASNLLFGQRPDEQAYNVILSYVYGYPNANPVIESIYGYWYIDGRNINLKAQEGAKASYGSETPDSLSNANDGDLYFLINSQNTRVYIRENGTWRNKLNLGLTNFSVNDKAVVTSSPSEQNRLENGTYYHHLISPFTGKPTNYIDSVTILGEDSGYLDALSTALFVMSDDVRQEYIAKHNLEVVISKDGKISYETVGLTNENALV